MYVEREAQLSQAHFVACVRYVGCLTCDVLNRLEQWKRFAFNSCSHHLLRALLTMTRKDDRELLEVLHFCIACCLHVYPPFRRIALPHALCVSLTGNSHAL